MSTAWMRKTTHRIAAPGLRAAVLAAAMLLPLQGCLAVAWVAAVAFDAGRTSDVEFQPFENSWTAPREAWLRQRPTKGIAVALDREFAEPFTTVLQQLTPLRVVDASSSPMVNPAGTEGHALTRALTEQLQVDSVLVGRVVEAHSEQAMLGLKARLSKRLHLELVAKDGHVIWRSELPYVVTQGEKYLSQEDVDLALERHLNSIEGEFQLPGLINSNGGGYTS